jgi:hypothetical protein
MVPMAQVHSDKPALATMIETSTTVSVLAMSTTGATLAKPTTMAVPLVPQANPHSFATSESTAWTSASLLSMC